MLKLVSIILFFPVLYCIIEKDALPRRIRRLLIHFGAASRLARESWRGIRVSFSWHNTSPNPCASSRSVYQMGIDTRR